MKILRAASTRLRIELASGHELDALAAVIQSLTGEHLERCGIEADVDYRPRVIAVFEAAMRRKFGTNETAIDHCGTP